MLAKQPFRPNNDGDTWRYLTEGMDIHVRRWIAAEYGALTPWLLANRPIWYRDILRSIWKAAYALQCGRYKDIKAVDGKADPG